MCAYSRTMINLYSTGTVEFVVDDDSTAIALGSGDVPVLGTPKVVALIEQASVAAIGSQLPDGATTVGTEVTILHLAPSRVGATVIAEAVVEEVLEDRLAFVFEVRDGENLVARGHHQRAIVDRDRFMG